MLARLWSAAMEWECLERNNLHWTRMRDLGQTLFLPLVAVVIATKQTIINPGHLII